MQDVRLSKDFWLREFTRSQTAARLGRPIEPSEEEIANLQHLCINLLQPIRDHFHRPITITSGLRPRWLNALVGGAEASEHIPGRAADFIVAGYTPYAACRAIEPLRLPFNQLILEFGQWIHISCSPIGIRPRREVLTARVISGRTAYVPDIVAA